MLFSKAVLEEAETDLDLPRCVGEMAIRIGHRPECRVIVTIPADRFIGGRLRTRARYADRRQNTETLEAMTQRLARHSHSLLPPRITEFLGQRVGVGDWGRFAAVYLKSICLHRLEPAERCNTLEIIRGRESSCNISIPSAFFGSSQPVKSTHLLLAMNLARHSCSFVNRKRPSV